MREGVLGCVDTVVGRCGPVFFGNAPLFSYLVQIRYKSHVYPFKYQVADCPRNSLYLVALSDLLYRQGEEEAALQPLINAIHYTPRLLTGKRIRDLQRDDPAFFKSLQQQLAVLAASPTDSPANQARLGYIACWLGNKPAADKYLRKAVKGLPNLATPWHLLGDDNKYRLLLFGAFRKDLLSTELPEEKEMSDELLFEMGYQPKFANWYGGTLLWSFNDSSL